MPADGDDDTQIHHNPLVEAFAIEISGTLTKLLDERYKSLSAVEVVAILAKIAGIAGAGLVKEGVPQPAAMTLIVVNINHGFKEAIQNEGKDHVVTTH